MAPGPNTRKTHPQHKIYPYLPRGVSVVPPNHAWSADMTYIRLAQGCVYPVASIEWYSRKVLAWQVSNTVDANFCVDCLVAASNGYGAPEIFNTDQGAQFIGAGWLRVLQESAIKISMAGRGRALDNSFVGRLWRSVKYEEVYPKNHASMPELMVGLAECFIFYHGWTVSPGIRR
jgi:putative transposase